MTGTIHALGQNPAANFTANVRTGCSPLTVAFTDQSTGNPTTWNWEFSNGTLSNAQNPSVTFSAPGTYSVKLVVQNATGIDQMERIDYITVYPPPTANFSANITLSCLPAPIDFTDLSSTATGTITSWAWDFGDGATSTLQNPSHTYNNAGFYTITLTVTNNWGCRRTISRGRYVRVISGVSTNFSYSISSTSCQAPFTVDFPNQSSGPGNISYTWDFGNGQTSSIQNPSTVYAAAGTYTVQLNAQSDLGCRGSVQKTITIAGTTTDFMVPVNPCLNRPVSFQNTSSASPVSSFWNFGDGTTSAQINPVKTFLTPGTYNVQLINQYARCTDSITKTITINDKPFVDFTTDDSSSCKAPFTVQFSDLTPGAVSWQWNFGDGVTSTLQNPGHQYNSFGYDTVSLTITTAAGCTNTITKTDFIKIQPVSLSLNVPAGGCIPFTYIPSDTIQTLDTIVSYVWDLGEPGAIFNVNNPPPYTYTTAGAYDISLTVTTVSGCTETVSVPGGILTGTPPIVNFSASPLDVCASEIISFTNSSVTTPGAQVEWLWDFGDGESSIEENPQHVFTDTGAITVTLTVSNNGCQLSASQILQVRPPVAGFTYTVDCNTRQVIFTDTSLVDPTLAPITYVWQMGDPANTQFAVQNPPPFSYPLPGTYDVTLTVTNGTCSYQTTKPVIIADEPADFSINKNPVCKNEIFTLTAINSNAVNITGYSWMAGTTTLPDTSQSAAYSIPLTGTYDVTLTITDINGCTTTKTVANYITVIGPAANFSPASGACLNKTTTFTDLSTPAGNITNWNFNFGDGTQQSFANPPFIHTYSQSGGYPVALTVTDISGCTDTYSLPASLLVTDPKAGFKADSFYCPNAALQFIDTSAGIGLTYLWDFGNGNTSTLQNPQNIYPKGDTSYTVKLTVTDISGCTDSVTKTNYIQIRDPKAAFDIEDTTGICTPLRTSFTFQGSNYQTFHWEFGDGGISTLPNPTYFYSDFGTFTPTLYVQGPGGCMDSAKSSVTIHNPADIQINYGPMTTACNSLNVDFNLILPPGFKFIFRFGDGTTDSSGRTSFSHFYSRPSFNTPALIIFDSISGCQTTITGRPRINIIGAIPLFGMNKKEFCDTGTVVFRDFTTKNEPIVSTVWDFGDGNTSNAQNPTHNYTQPGTYIARLNITTQSNCTSSYSDTVFVYRTPDPVILSKDTICLNVGEVFNGLTAVADSLTNWQWNFGNGQTSIQQNNSVIFTATGDYTIQLAASNKIGCGSTINKTIHVAPPPAAMPVQDPVTIISGTGANLLMNYTGNISSYNWLPNYRLNCNTCPVPFANPQFTTTYSVQVEDIYGCKNSSDITVVVVCNQQNFFVPNTFSPNGDGQNEVFFPRGTGLLRIKSMTIFNRWGQVVFDKKDFTANNPAAGWTGTFKGQKASADVYIYMMEILCDNNTVIPVKGNVTLLR